MSKLKNKILNFRNATNRLKEAALEFKQENASDVIRDGLIQRFEFTYELAWKTIKEYLEDIAFAKVVKYALDQSLHFKIKELPQPSEEAKNAKGNTCLLYTSPSPRD